MMEVMSRRLAFAFAAASLAACGALADLDGLSDGPGETKALAERPTDPPEQLLDRDADPGALIELDGGDAGDASDIIVLDTDGFETALDCEGWNPVNSTAEPVAGGYTGARSCLVCRSGDMYMDKGVQLPLAGTAVVDLWVKRRSNTPAGTSVVLILVVGEHYKNTSVTLTDTWTRVLLGIEAPEAGALGMRLIVDQGCFFLDDVTVRLDP
jgi:hypothetical protein